MRRYSENFLTGLKLSERFLVGDMLRGRNSHWGIFFWEKLSKGEFFALNTFHWEGGGLQEKFQTMGDLRHDL